MGAQAEAGNLGVDVYCAQADLGAKVEEIANRLSTGRLRVHEHLRRGPEFPPWISTGDPAIAALTLAVISVRAAKALWNKDPAAGLIASVAWSCEADASGA